MRLKQKILKVRLYKKIYVDTSSETFPLRLIYGFFSR